MAFDSICIVGTGFIGASIGLALKRHGIGRLIVGVDRLDVVMRARERGACDGAVPETQVAEAVKVADLIVLSMPMKDMLTSLDTIAESVKPGAVVIDTGVTKRALGSWARTVLPESVTYVGTHPLVGGTGRTGVEAADGALFDNSLWVVCPDDGVPADKLREVAELLKRLGARLVKLPPKEHDLIDAAVRELPAFVAVALLNMVEDLEIDLKGVGALAGSGMRELTRIAAGAGDTLKDYATTNRDALLLMVRRFQGELGRLLESLDRGDLETSFERARAFRERIPEQPRGFVTSHADILLHVHRRPGVFAKITGVLQQNNINLLDIESIRARNGDGSLRLTFETLVDAQKAADVLAKEGFSIRKG